MHNQSLLEQYVILDGEYKALESKREALREEILFDLKKNKKESVKMSFGVFTVVKKKLWKYTPAIKKIEDRLKIAKAKEQEKGLAEVSSTIEFITFKAKEVLPE